METPALPPVLAGTSDGQRSGSVSRRESNWPCRHTRGSSASDHSVPQGRGPHQGMWRRIPIVPPGLPRPTTVVVTPASAALVALFATVQLSDQVLNQERPSDGRRDGGLGERQHGRRDGGCLWPGGDRGQRFGDDHGDGRRAFGKHGGHGGTEGERGNRVASRSHAGRRRHTLVSCWGREHPAEC